MSKNRWLYFFILFFCCYSTDKVLGYTIAFPHSEEKAQVIVHEDSVATYQQLLACIDQAQRYIELCPCMTGGDLLNEILEHIHQRLLCVPELQAYMIIQPTVIDKTDQERLEKMATTWKDRFSYIFTDCPPHTNILFPNVVELHTKMSVFDGKYIIIGGTNFEDFMCTRGDAEPLPSDSPRLSVGGMQRPLALRDQDITIVSAQLGIEVRREFHAQYAMWSTYKTSFWFNKYLKDFRGSGPLDLTKEEAEEVHYPDLEAHPQAVSVDLKNIRILFSGPDEKENAISEEYAQLIQRATNRIYISHLYFLPTEKIFQSLMKALWDKGIYVEVVTNGCSEGAPGITNVYAWGNRMNYFPLCFGDRPALWKRSSYMATHAPNPLFAIREFHVLNTQLHKKCMVIDDQVFVIGSYNFGKKSDSCDYEAIVVIESPEVVRKAEEIFLLDEQLSVPVPPEQISQWFFHPMYHFIGHLEVSFMPA